MLFFAAGQENKEGRFQQEKTYDCVSSRNFPSMHCLRATAQSFFSRALRAKNNHVDRALITWEMTSFNSDKYFCSSIVTFLGSNTARIIPVPKQLIIK